MHPAEIASDSTPSRCASPGFTGGRAGGSLVKQDPQKSLHKHDLNPTKPEGQEWLDRYYDHLDSQKWQDLRNKVWDREQGLCQGCRSEPIEHVHHTTYARMGDELLSDLLGFCLNCHLKCHSTQKFK